MGVASVVSMAMLGVGAAWSVVLWRRLRDWRGGMLTLMVVAMAAQHAMRFVEWGRTGAAPSGDSYEAHLLVQSLLAALSVALLDLAMRGRLSLLKRLRDQHALMRKAEQVAGFGSWVWDEEAQTLSWSDGMYRLHGVDPKQFRPTPASARALYCEEDRAAFDAARLEGVGGEHRIQRPGGETRIVRTDVSVVRDASGRPRRTLGAMHDVTSQRAAAEALLEARDRAEADARSRSGFLASMSHEIRTPMTAILGYADLLLDEGLEEQARREHVETIRASGEHLLGLLNDILDLSKIEAGRLTVESIDTDCVALAEEVARLFGPRAKERGLTLRVRNEDDEPVVVRTDPTRLRQILMNLVGNAIKFTEQGAVTISVGLGESIGGRAALRLTVADTGVGMSEQEQTRIFEAFEQGADTTTRRFGGTGLGLAICQCLANLLGGEIGVESSPGVGSVFTLELIVERSDAAGSAPPACDGAAPPGRRPAPPDLPLRGRVLLVEDAPVNRRLFRTLLERFGLEVCEAEDGEQGACEAERAAREGRGFDLILMDVEMPVMNGLEAARRLRERGMTTPILALTAHAMADDRRSALEAGCSDYLTKPVDRARLRAACAQWLGVSAAPGDASRAA